MKLVFGWGVNNSETPTQLKEHRWICPFYLRWKSIIERGHSERYKTKRPTYKTCFVNREWKYFSDFKVWMEKQDWQGKEIDKDILFPGNNEYSSEKCVFVPHYLNCLLTLRGNDRGDQPLGVWINSSGKIAAGCSLGDGRTKHLGYFPEAMTAHAAWQKAKAEHIENQVSYYRKNDPVADERVCEALLLRAYNLRNQMLKGTETIKI